MKIKKEMLDENYWGKTPMEKEYTFDVCRDGREYINGHGESFFKIEEHTLKESELEDKHLDILYGQFMLDYNKLPRLIKDRVLEEMFLNKKTFGEWKK